jgi:hypothetical protein
VESLDALFGVSLGVPFLLNASGEGGLPTAEAFQCFPMTHGMFVFLQFFEQVVLGCVLSFFLVFTFLF